MKTEIFTSASLFDIQRTVADWIAAHPNIRVLDGGAPFAYGDQADLLDRGHWKQAIEYEDGESN